MLQMPSTVDNNDKGVGMQVWKTEERLIKKELVGEQCSGSEDEILAWSLDMVKEKQSETPLDGNQSNSAKTSMTIATATLQQAHFGISV